MAFCCRLDYAVNADPSNGLRRLAFKIRVTLTIFFNLFLQPFPKIISWRELFVPVIDRLELML
jgi:hypothetical protein